MSDLDTVLSAVEDLARRYLSAERDAPIQPRRDPLDLRASLDLSITGPGEPLDDVLSALQEVLLATPYTATPRFFNQLYAGRDAAATIAEMLTAVTNTSMYTFKVAGVQVLIEQEVIARMARAAGTPSAEGMLTPGGSISNLAAMILARDHAAQDARDNGLTGAPLAVYASADAHYSLRKAAGFVGIGRDAIRFIPIDDNGAIDVDALARAIERDTDKGVTPMMIALTAGTTVRGAFDPIAPVAPIARANNCWLHVDGAYGGSVLLSPRRAHLLQGVEHADSFSWNPHKMMGVPLACSVLLTTRRGALHRSFSENADYLFQQDDDDLNPGTRSMQCGRRNDALKLWAAWKHHGDDGYARRIERLFHLAHHATARVTSDPDLILACPTISTNVCFEVRAKPTESICDALDRSGRIKVGYGVVNGRRVIRLVCLNPLVTEADVDTFFDEVLAAARALPDADNAVKPQASDRALRR